MSPISEQLSAVNTPRRGFVDPAVRAKALAVRDQARPGNQNAARRRRLYAIAKDHPHVNERIRTLARGVIDHLGLDEVKDMSVVRAWCKAEIMATECYRYVLMELEKGELIGKLLSEWRQTQTLQLQLAREIGMTPASRVTLGLDVQRGRTLNAAEQLAQERLRQKAVG